MDNSLTGQNKNYWQNYKPGEVPSVPKNLPLELIDQVSGPVLDVGTGDGALAEDLSRNGFEVYGIDVAENIITENQKRKTNVYYSIDDITRRTKFLDNFFDLLIFKFTLTNIHKDSWSRVAKEVLRILKPSGKIWILEPLVSQSYKKRYELASDFIDDQNCVYVFNDKDLADKVATTDDLQKAIEDKKVSRIVKHYTVKELENIFHKLKLEDYRIIKVISPSGFVIKTFEGIFSKKNKSH